MTVLAERPRKARASRTARRFGYVVAIAINGAMLYIVNNLVGWDLLPWITDDFQRLVPLFNLSIGVTIAVNAVRLFFDPAWFRSITELVTLAFSLVVTIRVWQVFPFSFDGTFAWANVVRGVLILASVGVAAGMLAEVVRFVTGASRPAHVD